MQKKIDLVVPYVDCDDPEWQSTFNAYNTGKITEASNGKTRFRGQGEFFRFFFRCLEANLPWLNNVFLLVATKSQVPKWINTSKVTIVEHAKFIPAKFLPTFNSCTIELFLWNIPGLQENFIYLNDDFFVTNKLLPGNFFEANSVNISLLPGQNINTMYIEHCRNGYELIFGEKENYKMVSHIPRPYKKSLIKECFLKNEKKLCSSITRFRSTNNINCYVYIYYLDKLGLRNGGTITQKYLDLANMTKLSDTKILNLLSRDCVCINDTGTDLGYKNKRLFALFNTKFPNTSKFENSPLAKSQLTYKIKQETTYIEL